jgi:hypothetical protein
MKKRDLIFKILSAPGSFPTARNIRQAIEEITGKHYLVTSDNSTTKNVLFRYGNADSVEGIDNGINSREFITLAKNKYLFAEFAEKNQIYSPVYHKFDLIPTEFPVMIRSTLTGYRGFGIKVVNSLEEFQKKFEIGNWWTKFIPCSFELRVHLFENKINRLYKKQLLSGTEKEFPIRNAEAGYHFSNVDENLDKYPKLIPVMENLGNLLKEKGGKYCAVDVGWDSIKKQYFIFEINSAPGLNSINIKEYAEYIIEKIGEQNE